MHVVQEAKKTSSPLPLYFKVMIDLRERIFSGEWPAGSQIPGEVDLAKELGVSVITVRQALGQLVQEGLIQRQRAKGSFVSPDVPIRQSVSLDVEVEDLVTVHPETKFHLDRVEETQAPRTEKEKLRLKENEGVSKVTRIRMLHEQPLEYIISYVPSRLGSQIPEHALATLPLPKAIETFSPITITEVDHTVRAVLSDDDVSFQLQIPAGSPVLLIERDYLSQAEIVAVSKGYYRNDLFRYELKLKRKGTR